MEFQKHQVTDEHRLVTAELAMKLPMRHLGVKGRTINASSGVLPELLLVVLIRLSPMDGEAA